MKDRIKELCKNKGISKNALEKELGFASGYISKLGKTKPNSEYLQKIADYFGVSTDYILKGEEKPNYSDEMAHMYAKIRKDTELSKALLKYFELSDVEKKKIIDIINVLSDK